MKDAGFLKIQSSTTQGLRKQLELLNFNTFFFGGRYFATQSICIVHRFYLLDFKMSRY